jgi:hypothetical protein
MCVLRASGDHFDPESFLRDSTLQPCNIFLKGERRSESSVWGTCGIAVPTSGAEMDDFPKQVADSVQFLKSNRDELLRLKTFEGVNNLRLDFGVNRRKVSGQYQFFPPDLVTLAGQLGLGLEISTYGTDE